MSSSTSSLSSLSSESSNYLKPKIALIGSGGLLGDATLTTLLSSEFSDHFAKPIRVLTRDITQPLPPNVTFLLVDWDDDNIDEHLTRCLRGVSVVVNLLGHNPDAWDAVTRAVCRVKPQLYIPPEFSFDHTLWDSRRIKVASVADDKRRQSEMARDAGIRTVQIFCGVIMENIISGLPTGVDFVSPRRKIMALTADTGGEAPISFTSSWDVGKAIAAVATMPAAVMRGDLDQVYISGDTGSWNKLGKLMGAQVHPISASSFESQVLNRSSPIEHFIRIAAAEGQLYFPSPQSSRARRGVATNHNYLVDAYMSGSQHWFKLAQVVRHFDKNDNDTAHEPGTSSPEEPSKELETSKKRKRGSNDDSASVDSNNAHNENPQTEQEDDVQNALESYAEASIPLATSPKKQKKPKNSKPRSSTRKTRTATQQVSTAVLEKRVTRSMTKPTLPQEDSKTLTPQRNKKKTGGDSQQTNKATAATRRTSKRRRVG